MDTEKTEELVTMRICKDSRRV